MSSSRGWPPKLLWRLSYHGNWLQLLMSAWLGGAMYLQFFSVGWKWDMTAKDSSDLLPPLCVANSPYLARWIEHSRRRLYPIEGECIKIN